MHDKDRAKFCLEALKRAGADKCECFFTRSAGSELNAENGEISLFRTTFEVSVNLAAIKGQRRGEFALNADDKDAIEKGAGETVKLAESSPRDESYDIAECQPPAVFDNSVLKADKDAMYEKLSNFLRQAKERYPKITIRNASINFVRKTVYYLNLNGVDFTSSKGIYRVMAMFSARDGEKTSSFNYSSSSSTELKKEILEMASFDILLKQSSEQTETKFVNGKFSGDIIVTPDCLGDFTDFISQISIGDAALISGTSVYKDKLGKRIASDVFSLYSKPVPGEICDGYFITSDGYKAENLTIVENGILRSFLLSLYGSRKTGLERAPSSGGCYVVSPGSQNLAELVSSVKRGLLVARFSGGRPNENGDFSGIAKNSYYIEDGQIRYPVSETMISGNIPEMFLNIKGVSRERVDFGSSIFPWVSFAGINISGK